MLMFLEVAEAQSFSAAAARLGKTTSALSQAVKRLERDIDDTLFYRTTRSVTLTEAGSLLLFHCRELRRVRQTALDELQRVHDHPRGTLTVTAPHALCAPVIVPALSKYRSQFPEVKIRLISDDSPLDLTVRQVDVAVRIGTPSITTARIVKIGNLTESLYASRSYVESQGGIPVKLEDLGSWQHIANEWQGSPVIYELNATTSIKVTPDYRCNTILDVLQFTQQGAGIALLPDVTADVLGERNTLQKIHPLNKSPIYAVNQFDGRTPLKVSKFIQALKGHMAVFK